MFVGLWDIVKLLYLHIRRNEIFLGGMLYEIFTYNINQILKNCTSYFCTVMYFVYRYALRLPIIKLQK